jgi:hypothetical protein
MYPQPGIPSQVIAYLGSETGNGIIFGGLDFSVELVVAVVCPITSE